MREKIFYFTVFLLLLTAPLFFIFSSKNVEAQYGEMPMVEVLAYEIKKEKIEIAKEFPARVNSYRIAEIRPQISGIILKRLFVEGSLVQENQQLYQIDPEPFIANLKSAFANLKISEAALKPVESKLERYKELVKIDAISKQEFEEIEADFASKKADVLMKQAFLRKAEIDFEYTKVFAPISGKIGKSFASEGSLVQVGQENSLAIITQLDPIYVDISIPNQDYFSMKNEFDKEKIKVELFIPGTNSAFENLGELKFAESIIDESTGSVALRAIFENKEAKLLPGLFVKVKLKLAKKEMILAPQNAVIIDFDGSARVFVIDEKNIVTSRKIKINQSYENYWIVENGLKEGEKIVLEGFQKIQNGMKVQIALQNQKLEEKLEEKIEQEDLNLTKKNVNENLDLSEVFDEKENLTKEEYEEKISKFIKNKIENAKEINVKNSDSEENSENKKSSQKDFLKKDKEES